MRESPRSGLASAVAYFLRKLIRGYQLTLSPYIGRQCRFYPTCSVYADEAIALHGPWHGMRLTLLRLGKCHPFHPGGVDDVPSTITGLEQKKGELCCPQK